MMASLQSSSSFLPDLNRGSITIGSRVQTPAARGSQQQVPLSSTLVTQRRHPSSDHDESDEVDPSMSLNLQSGVRLLRRRSFGGHLPSLQSRVSSRMAKSRSLELPEWQDTATVRSLSENAEEDAQLGCFCGSCQEIRRENRLLKNRHKLLVRIGQLAMASPLAI